MRMFITLAILVATLATPASAQEFCPALRWTTLGTAGAPVPTPDRSEPSNLLDLAVDLASFDVGCD